MKYHTKESIFAIAESVLGKRIGDYDVDNKIMSTNSKGRIGHILEANVFNLQLNNLQEPDFKELGIELKTTGYKWIHKGQTVSAKERLVITMIDYFNDINTGFYNSHLYRKIDQILLVLYEYEEGKKLRDMIYTNYYFYEYKNIPEVDKLIIENDWKIITNKIKNGKAHELSEGDTMYLGACTKGTDSNSLVKQPFNSTLAKSRAFSLKNRYMTNLFRNQIFNDGISRESFIKNIQQLQNNSFEEVVNDTLYDFVGKSLDDIDIMLDIKVNRKNSKQFLYSYTMRMLNMTSDNPDTIEEFEKANIKVKTIRLEENGSLKESMSFPAFSFIKVAQETWDESEINEYFDTTKFLFMVFQKSGNNLTFLGSFFWNMNSMIIESNIKSIWSETHKILNSTIDIRIKNNRIYNNFPNSKFNGVAHVRNHGQNRMDTSPLPSNTMINIIENDGSINVSKFIEKHEYSRLSFWLNAKYIEKLVYDHLDNEI